MSGVERIAIERQRQIEGEGYTRQHDVAHGAPVLSRAARCYEVPQVGEHAPDAWPWDESYWKPRDHVSNLIRAGALYQAAADVAPPLGQDGAVALAGRDRCAEAIDAIYAHVMSTRA